MNQKAWASTLWRLTKYLGSQKLALSMVLITAALGTAFQIVGPILIGQVVDELFQGVIKSERLIDVHFIIQTIGILIGLYLLSAIFNYVQQLLAGIVSQHTVFELRKSLDDKLAKLPLRFYDSRSRGDVLSRAVNDVDVVGNTLQQVITQLLSSVITILGVVVMMLMLSPVLTLVMIVIIPLSYIGIKSVAKRSMPHFMDVQKTLGELSGHVEETYAGHTIVKTYGTERQNIETFEAMNHRLYMSGKRAQFIAGLMMPLMFIINNISFIFICMAGGLLVIRGSITVGEVQAFIQYARTFSQPLMQLANITNMLQAGLASAERIFEILDEPDDVPDATKTISLGNPRGEVRFEDVHFRYKPETPLIEQMNIAVHQGQTVAIVGPTGAGKSTIVNLLLRFYELDGGRIMIDGIDIKELSRSELRRLFAMVLQDTWLFKGTVKQNLAYGKPDASEAEIRDAAVAIGADSFIRRLPEGYDTLLDEGGDTLSQGQRQLLTIARALLANPTILILDEATSNVDTRTEEKIQQAMRQLMEGRTSFVIAHRLSTIREADVILVMDQGRIVEQGKHEELLERGGYYAELYHSQFEMVDSEAV